jgi:LemA protein
LKKSLQKLENELGTSKGAEVDKSISKLMALAEQYPDLKATQSFQDLMEKSENAENRIASMRETYSRSINRYNTTIQSFPDNVFAHLLPFEKIERYHPEKEPMPIRNWRIFWQPPSK